MVEAADTQEKCWTGLDSSGEDLAAKDIPFAVMSNTEALYEEPHGTCIIDTLPVSKTLGDYTLAKRGTGDVSHLTITGWQNDKVMLGPATKKIIADSKIAPHIDTALANCDKA